MVNPTFTPIDLPETCSIAFKEWAGVCAALARGDQALILRKGGIEEGPGGFVPEHPIFWLYPTYVHESEQGLKTPISTAPPIDSRIVLIDSLIVIESISRIDAWDRLTELESLHNWTQATVLKRFEYRKPGLWVLGVRVYKTPDPMRVEVTTSQLGCKSWVPLDPPLATDGLSPVRAESEAKQDRDRLADALQRERQGL